MSTTTTTPCAEQVQILGGNVPYPAFRLRNSATDDKNWQWIDLGLMTGSNSLFFLRADSFAMFVGDHPPLASALSFGCPLTRYISDLAYDKAAKSVVFTVSVVGGEGNIVEFKNLKAFALPPPMFAEESQYLRHPELYARTP
jgi:hypothetical protein